MMIPRLILAILATYRLAQLVVFDDGPLFIFARLREWSDREAVIEQDDGIKRGLMSSLADGLHCPYCVGVWAAGLCAILVTFPTKMGDIFLTCLAIAGGQAILERNGK